MGTTLTGTTPQDTYDSLIKVTDNGPLTGSLKRLTDGLGNDSSLSLSTAAARIAGNLTVKTTTERANITTDVDLVTENGIGILSTSTSYGQGYQYVRFFNSSAAYAGSISQISATGIGLYSGASADLVLGANSTERMRITAAGNVGIGTSTPPQKLSVYTGNTDAAFRAVIQNNNPYVTSGYGSVVDVVLENTSTTNGTGVGILFLPNTTLGACAASVSAVNESNNYASALTFQTRNAAGTDSEKLRILSSGGITFNGDTAAANALDDYEEGTFTATLTPSTSGTITSGATFTTWSYTKIGRQVTINGAFVISSVSSPVGDLVNVGGLPFTVRNSNDSFGAVSAGYADASAAYAKSSLWAVHGTNTTTINLGIDASTVAASDEFYVTATYFTN